MFTLDPKETLREQILVLIESRAVTCGSQAPRPLRETCQRTENRSDVTPIHQGSFVKVAEPRNPAQWIYVRENQGEPEIVASCFAMANGKDGLCTVVGAYRNLLYSFGLKDREVQNIPRIEKSISDRLLEWET